jgi:hypothetical protein
MTIDVTLTFPDGAQFGPLSVTPLGDNRYRAEESAMSLGESEQIIRYGDIIELEPTSAQEALFLRVAESSPYQSCTYVVSTGLIFTDEFREFEARLVSVGGHYEVVFGGLLIVHVPPNAAIDVQDELNKMPSVANLGREELQKRYEETDSGRQFTASWDIPKRKNG